MMTNLDTVIHNLRKQLSELERINTMLKDDELRQIYHSNETRVGKDLDALDINLPDYQVRSTAWEQDDRIEHSHHYYDYDRNR
tara:strand:+ start:179 stop:427 length:249 start_codon:yes stop_codon:yes gene_type:complete